MEHKVLRTIAGAVGPVAAFGFALVVALAQPSKVHAEDAEEAAARRERCATRLSVALLGESPSAALLAASDPQAQVEGLLRDEAFVERFARFVNAQFNPEPGEAIPEDASYTLAKHVVGGDEPWRAMFVGKYRVGEAVADDADGLGYFRSPAWMKRYAGNEEAGYRIAAAYRIMQNTVGLELTATTNVEGVDLTATGRQAPACAGCHYQSWYALDLVSKVLSRRQGEGDDITFTPPTEGPQKILGGQTIANDEELVEALVKSDDFRFQSCRLAFKFLYGRAETTCEAPVFDKCVDAFDAKGTMKAAIAAIATDPTFCQ